jgi:hypothetical protein
MIVVMIELFCLRFGPPQQHAMLNRGQAVMWFISLQILVAASNAGESVELQETPKRTFCTGIFTLILLATIGGTVYT